MLGVQYGDKKQDSGRVCYQPITPEAVRQGLWLYEYGFADGVDVIDGTYHRERDTIDVVKRILEKGQIDRQAIDQAGYHEVKVAEVEMDHPKKASSTTCGRIWWCSTTPAPRRSNS